MALPTAQIVKYIFLVGRGVGTGNNFSTWVIEATNDIVTSDATAGAAEYTLLYTSNN